MAYFPILDVYDKTVPTVFWPYTEADYGRYSQSISHGYKLRGWKPQFALMDSWSQYGLATKWRSGNYSIGDYVYPSPSNDHIYMCAVAGTTGASQPEFTTTHEATQVDGSVTWVCFPDNQLQAVAEFIDNRKGRVVAFQVWIPFFGAWVKSKFSPDSIQFLSFVVGVHDNGILVELAFEETF